jgi:hypothetical protein
MTVCIRKRIVRGQCGAAEMARSLLQGGSERAEADVLKATLPGPSVDKRRAF